MVALVTLGRLKEALRIDSDDEDGILGLYIDAASLSVISYLKGQADVVLGLDSGGDIPSGAEVPEPIQLATIVLVGHIYRNPDGDPDKDFEHGYLPRPVTALLYPYRDPALA